MINRAVLVIALAFCSSCALSAPNSTLVSAPGKTAAVVAGVPVSAQSILDLTLRRFAKDHDVSTAREGLLKAASADPKYALPCYYLGLLAESDENWADAIKWLEQFVSLENPNSQKCLQAKSDLDSVRKFQEMDATPEGKKRRQYDIRMQRGQACAGAGMLKLAISEAAKAAEIDSSRWESYALAASILSSQKGYAQAAEFLKKALDRAPDAKKGTLQAALDGCAKEQQYADLMKSGAGATATGDNAKAAEDLNKALALFPDRASAKLALATMWVLGGEYEKANEILISLRGSSDPAVAKQAKEIIDRLAIRRAGTIIVAKSGPGDYTTINDALKNAKPNTLILVKPGTYDESIYVSQPVAIVGNGPRDQICVVPPEEDYATAFKLRTKGPVELRNLSMRVINSQKPNTYGIDTSYTVAVVDGCDIQSSGNGIKTWGGNATVRNCSIRGENGVSIEGGSATIDNCDIGGAEYCLWVSPGHVSVSNSLLHGAKHDGLTAYRKANVTLELCDIRNNGTGVNASMNSTATVRNCTFTGNARQVYCDPDSTLTITPPLESGTK